MHDRIVFIVTQDCNLHCAHCLRYSNDCSRASHLSLDIVEKVLDDARDMIVPRVALTGGEPGCHPEFEKIVDAVVKHGRRFSFVTNANDPKLYDFIFDGHYHKALNSISVSVDGSNQGIYRKMRPDGNLDTVIETIRDYVRRGISVTLITCLTKYNIDDFDNIVKLAASLQVKELFVVGLLRFPYNEHLALSEDQARLIYNKIRYYKKNITRLNITVSVSFGYNNFAPPRISFCNYMQSPKIVVRSDGKYSFCCDGEQIIMGSSQELPIKAIYKKHLDFINFLHHDRYELISRNFGAKTNDFSTCNYCLEAYNRYCQEKAALCQTP